MKLARTWQVVATAALGVAVAGYFAGLRPPPSRAVAPLPPAASAADSAISYTEQRRIRPGVNAEMYVGAVAALAPQDPPEITLPSEDDRERAIISRAQRRAFDGAPPTVPHAIDERAAPACLSCHEHGARIASKVARRMSHARYEGCTQCHVSSNEGRVSGPMFSPEPNQFAGLASEVRGERASPGAPPTIPHSTLMRGQCKSCHGPAGLHGLRTSHPSRTLCVQCHAPSAALDQREEATPSARDLPR